MKHIDSAIDSILSGDAEPDAAAQARAHLAGCERCRNEWSGVLDAHRLLLLNAATARHDGALRRPIARARRSASGRARSLAVAALCIIALAAAFFAGHESGRRSAVTTDGGGSEFLLLLVGGDASSLPAERRANIGADFRRWTEQLRGSGGLLSQGQLMRTQSIVRGPLSRPLPEDRDALDAVNGYFIVRAPTEVDARRIAQTMPYLEMHGSVIVREIARAP